MYCCADVHFIVFYLVALRDAISKVHSYYYDFISASVSEGSNILYCQCRLWRKTAIGLCSKVELSLTYFNKHLPESESEACYWSRI